MELKRQATVGTDQILWNEQRHLSVIIDFRDWGPNSLHNFGLEVPCMTPVKAKAPLEYLISTFLCSTFWVLLS